MTRMVVMLGFDDDTDGRLRDAWGLVGATGPRHPPHLTVAVVDADLQSVVDVLAPFADATMWCPVSWAGLGVFPERGVTYAAPVVTAGLIGVHAALCGALHEAGLSLLDDRYLPGRWVPHATLCVGPSPSDAVEAASAALPMPDGRVDRVLLTPLADPAVLWSGRLAG